MELRRGKGWRLLAILLVAAAAVAVLYTTPIRWGLDLQGGVQVVLEAQDVQGVQVTESLIDRAQAVIERRVNGLGVAEPVIQRQGDRRIIVELPGVHDHEQAIQVIGKTALLEFKDPAGNTVFTGSELRSATLTTDEYGRPAVSIELSREGAARFAELTARYLHTSPLPIVLDGEVLVAPVPQSVINDGRAVITGNFTLEEARNLAILLQSGALPVPLEVMEVRNVGPVLGRESVQKSLVAGIVGVALIAAYMVLYYRLPGGVADVALALYVVVLLGLLVGLRATLTLPGLAGFVLSLGMAVDANVIIFERVREELRAGKRLRAAMDAGWKRAFVAIFDANVTTLISAVILMYFGTGPVRGFAVTLSLGILVSMFTAVVVTRTLLALLVDRDPDRFARYFGVKEVAAR
ncbi:MAG: protein translocase subunit SecD [Firmicutes bacterium]|nr:protein translocase subunit SecD [Bacillota bacterium]MBO2520647.1 protein translocase subunit SecD [Bacillota bacterium]